MEKTNTSAEQSNDGATSVKVAANNPDSANKHGFGVINVPDTLENTWTFWTVTMDRFKSWEDCLTKITSFNKAEDFWNFYNHTKVPSKQKHGNDYFLFRKGIPPIWYDDANKNGGRWLIKLEKKDIDSVWLDVLLFLIREICDYSYQICGAVVNIRKKQSKISIWTVNGNDEKAVLEIGQKLCDTIRFPLQGTMHYDLYNEIFLGTNVKSRYTL